MDVSQFWSHFSVEPRVSVRIPTLPEWVRKKFRLPRNSVATGLLYLFLSGGLGWSAYQMTQHEVLLNWKKAHLPSSRILKASWVALGLREMTESHQQQRVLRSLPVSTDTAGRLWVSSEWAWVAYFVDEEAGSGLRVFCYACHSTPKDWEPAPVGWDGFEEVLKALEEKIAKEKLAKWPKVEQRSGLRDPREIVY